MTRRKSSGEIRGGASVLLCDQPSFVDDGIRRGKHFAGPRKVADLSHVGVLAPDVDPEHAVAR